ncbi:hypothetical protein AXF42_Ash018690 [Apostasia shenzhenica]|uniref:Uncharacterized protein n=1 Tax=Apostasia shenzhenica TaxID=1088818 RepID=A0A2H9ZZM7_9ASPA|nr:hypothetical protein AXF42_Ash018690 [Apostasia shenzhenica]
MILLVLQSAPPPVRRAVSFSIYRAGLKQPEQQKHRSSVLQWREGESLKPKEKTSLKPKEKKADGTERRQAAACRSSPLRGPLCSVSCRGTEAGAGEEDEEAAEAEAFCEEGVRKKMGVLARMVGMEGCRQPGAVLTEVVRVLKELDGRARGVCSSSKR